MSSLQKIIKYGAITLAIILIIGVIASIASAIFGLGFFLASPRETKSIQEDYREFKAIEIDNSFGDVEIKATDKFSVKAENVSTRARIENKDGKLTIKNNERVFNLFGWNFWQNDNPKITINVPASFQLTEILIKNGAGNIRVSDISTERLKLETAVGKFTADTLISAHTEINGGAGEIQLENSLIGNLSLKSGVGSVYLSGDITGASNVECGVGKLTIELARNIKEYNIEVETGLGAVKFNDEKAPNQLSSSSGAKDELALSIGVGEVNINFPEEIS